MDHHAGHVPIGRAASGHPTVVRLGRLGWLAKGIVYLLAGALALRRIALRPWGMLLVGVVGIGFMAYGMFCALTFTRRRLVAA